MNKFVNILLLLLLIPVFALSIFISFDLPIELLKTSGKNLPFLHYYYVGFAILIFWVGAKRSFKRWIGVRMINQTSKFQWNEEIDVKRKKQVNMYLMIEGILHLLTAFALFALTSKSLILALVFLVLAIDHFVFLCIGNIKNAWRLGVTNKAIVVAERDFKILYYSGLRRVSVHQQTIFFDYIKDLQLAISVDDISVENRKDFKRVLEQKVDRSKVHFHESFKSF
jgi:hypothetical protein